VTRLKSERHHWWPECVSEFWKDADGCAHWMLPSGEIKYLRPKNFGVIGNGHHIKLGRKPSESTAWDESFEAEFRQADSDFPRVIEWLEGLDRESRPLAAPNSRFLKQDADDNRVRMLVEGIVSLAVRSPMAREAAVGLTERLKGPLPERERNGIMGLNMRHCQRMVADSIGTRGKFAIIYSPEREFIFGDGFLHNIMSPSHPPMSPKILVPLTPGISVLYASPLQYTVEPRLSTFVASADEAELLNNTVQVYARNAIFYRSEQPAITADFRHAQHRRYSEPNPIDNLIQFIPGVPPRDTSLDMLRSRFRSA